MSLMFVPEDLEAEEKTIPAKMWIGFFSMHSETNLIIGLLVWTLSQRFQEDNFLLWNLEAFHELLTSTGRY